MMKPFIGFVTYVVLLAWCKSAPSIVLLYGMECCYWGQKIAGSQESKCFNLSVQIQESNVNQNQCQEIARYCCDTKKQQIHCSIGIQSALKHDAEDECGKSIENHHTLCCMACQMGRKAAESYQSCDAHNTNRDTLLRDAYTQCCVQYSIQMDASETRNTNLSEHICDVGDVCAQVCIQRGNSYECGCNKGYTLMNDGVSCKPDRKRANKASGRCLKNNPCDHECIDTGSAIKCACREGYKLASDKRTCDDINECALNTHLCMSDERCVNENGTYYCVDPDFADDVDDFDQQCPAGYKFNGEKQVCDDINECEIEIICPRPKMCVNTIGSFRCDDTILPQCPPGFSYLLESNSCEDINECTSDSHNCHEETQICLNTKGNYTCADKMDKNMCPPGFKRNIVTHLCDDINECEEIEQPCSDDEICLNESGGHTCSKIISTKDTTSTTLLRPFLFQMNSTPTNSITKTTTEPTALEVITITTEQNFKRLQVCGKGYKANKIPGNCIDVNECLEEEPVCDSTQNCINTVGSYECICKIGYSKDHQTAACIDINECQTGSHRCTDAQRCDNTIGSYLCARITGCGTGYTLNYANGLCEDDDECALGLHNCNDLGTTYKCRNTLGSYRCDSTRGLEVPVYVIPTTKPKKTESVTSKKVGYSSITTTHFPNHNRTMTTKLMVNPRRCLPGFRVNYHGVCEDINECLKDPCPNDTKCLNFNGYFQCIPGLQCKIGYELDESRTNCIDVNECTRGWHKCNPTQICKNGHGYYTCECPVGHRHNNITNKCEDVDECKYHRTCSINANCINTVGSYYCKCKQGFQQNNNTCEDIDECSTMTRLCEHKCVNMWGSYRCACNSGFTLNSDNRTCSDLDECKMFKDKRLCIGTCENVPGSYKCTCPAGYLLGSDGRICKDIDECERNICHSSDDVCVNTRGGYKCYTINCPSNYIRSTEHKGRCKRPQTLCDTRDMQCILQPEQYIYYYMSFVSNLPIDDEDRPFFQLRGPQWQMLRAEFNMKVTNLYCPSKVPRVDQSFFKMLKTGYNTIQLYLSNTIQGPQEIDIEIKMHVFDNNILTSNVVSHIIILVSEYSF